MATVTDAARELYGLVPAEFTAARNALAQQAADGGDRELAARIRKLPKPPVAAWAVNALVRHRPDEVHGDSADQVVIVLRSSGVGDHRVSEKRDQRGEQKRIHEDHCTCAHEVLVLGVLDLSVHLGEGFFPGHGENRVAKCNQDTDQAEEYSSLRIQTVLWLFLSVGGGGRIGAWSLARLDAEGVGSDLRHPTDGVAVKGQVQRGGRRRKSLLLGLRQDGYRAPHDQEDHHDSCDVHDP